MTFEETVASLAEDRALLETPDFFKSNERRIYAFQGWNNLCRLHHEEAEEQVVAPAPLL
jgi:hypothetical protein